MVLFKIMEKFNEIFGHLLIKMNVLTNVYIITEI